MFKVFVKKLLEMVEIEIKFYDGDQVRILFKWNGTTLVDKTYDVIRSI